jgi:hypothetical protein
VRQHVPDVQPIAIEVDDHDQPKLISADVEDGATPDLIRMGINLAHVGKFLPRCVFGGAMPPSPGLFRVRPLLPGLPELLLGNDVHPSSSQAEPNTPQYFRKMRTSQG